MAHTTVVLGVIGSDCHSVGNRILEEVFSDGGFKVVNLGVMVSQEEFINAAIETGASAILVSSLYGHGEIDCEGLPQKCIEKGLENVVLYVGGNLAVGKTDHSEIETKFLNMGFHRVFHPDADLDNAVSLLQNDISHKDAA